MDRMSESPLLSVQGLTVQTRGVTPTTVLRDVGFSVRRGEVLAMVGESGSGKSTACLAVAGLLGSGLEVSAGSMRFEDVELTELGARGLRALRGREIGLVLQDPTASLNPVRRIGAQLTETRRVHRMGFGGSASAWAEDMLRRVGLPEPARVRRSYPSQLSGGMRQRVCLGIGFSGDPSLVIADEPTTSLDMSSQGRILHLLLRMKQEQETSVMLVSHDLHVVRSIADRVVVLYGGRVVESGPTEAVMSEPQSQYTAQLLRSVPRASRTIQDAALPTIPGSSENAWQLPGCPFAPRCDAATDICHEQFPERRGTDSHGAWCWNPPEASVVVEGRTTSC